MSLEDKAVLLCVDFSIPSGTKSDRRQSEKVASDNNVLGGRKSAGNYQKIIMERKLFKPYHKIKTNIIGYIDSITLPYMNGSNIRILGNGSVIEASDVIRKAKNSWENEKSLTLAAYSSHIEEAKDRLGALFNATDYPFADALLDKLQFSSSIRPMPTLDCMDFRFNQGQSEEELDKIKEEVKEDMKKSLESSVKELHYRMHETVTHMKNVLDKDDPRIFNSLINKVHMLVKVIPKLNIMEDQNLNTLAVEMEDDLLCYSIEELREDETTRFGVVSSATMLIDKMERIYGLGS